MSLPPEAVWRSALDQAFEEHIKLLFRNLATSPTHAAIGYFHNGVRELKGAYAAAKIILREELTAPQT